MHAADGADLLRDEARRGNDLELLPARPQKLQRPLEIAVPAHQNRHVVGVDGVEHVEHDLDVEVRLLLRLAGMGIEDRLDLLGDERVADARERAQIRLLLDKVRIIV